MLRGEVLPTKKNLNLSLSSFLVFSGRGGGIRTRDLLLPKQALYQAKLRPDKIYYSAEADWLYVIAAKKRKSPEKKM